jgi:hypothetical protein
MSEFTSICPKCRQQILCDTAYAGLRVACPICLQEITMPTPQQQPQSPAGTPLSHNVPEGKQSPVMLIAAIGGVVLVLVLAVGAIIITYNRAAQIPPATASPTPVATAAPAPSLTLVPIAAPAPAPAVLKDAYTNHMTLDTKSFTVKITEVRQTNVMNCLWATYDGFDKAYHRGIVIKGQDTYAAGADGAPNRFLGWTFINPPITYFVSEQGHLKVTEGTNVLVSEQGKWKEKPKRQQPNQG